MRTPWPVPFLDAHHTIGNVMTQFQDYGGGAYYHGGDDLRVQSSLLYAEYKKWCLETSHNPVSSTTIATEWERLGFVKIAPHNIKHWIGVGLKARVTF